MRITFVTTNLQQSSYRKSKLTPIVKFIESHILTIICQSAPEVAILISPGTERKHASNVR